MTIKLTNSLTQVIWVAAYPPVPPFSGFNQKTLNGIDALTGYIPIKVISVANLEDHKRILKSFNEYWKGRPVELNLLKSGSSGNLMSSLLTLKFNSSHSILGSSIPEALEYAGWDLPDHLVILDDIVLAPLAERYGHNTILSPHDCISEMFKDHYQLLPVGLLKIKKFIQYIIARRAEQRYYHHALLIHLVTQRDKFLLSKINPGARYHVVSNTNLSGPKFEKTNQPEWDVMIWGDLNIGSAARGVRDLLKLAASDPKWLSQNRLAIIGSVSYEQANRILGKDLAQLVEYAKFMEDDQGHVRQARITVVPDIGGVGIKNRSINLLASGCCLACLYFQMEGLEQASDIGAINASTMEELFKKVKKVLKNGLEIEIGEAGQKIFNKYYAPSMVQEKWMNMLQRAIVIRNLAE